MSITDTDLAFIRDETGTEPDDNTLSDWFDELGHWLPVTIRVLKRRRADATAGGQEVASFSLDGVLSVGMSKASLTGLDRQITRLEDAWVITQGGTSTQVMTTAPILRPDRYR